MSEPELRKQRRDMQIIFQDPYSSLNPRMRVLDIVGEALDAHGIVRGNDLEPHVAKLLARVGVSPSWVNRYPHEFSGGQRQRIGVARAIALNPKLIVCDEAVSALDVSIQAQILNLLIELREEMNLAYLFIAHDLSVVRHISHRIAVMYLGQVVELASSDELFQKPLHPYTQALLSAIPVPDPKQRDKRRIVLEGDVPTPINPPSGCRFHTRCPAVFDRCHKEEPPLIELTLDKGPTHYVKCFHAELQATQGDVAEIISRNVAERVAENEQARDSTRELGSIPAAADDGAEAPAPSIPPTRPTLPPVMKNRNVWAGVLAALGALLVVTAHWLLGFTSLLVAYPLGARRLPAWARVASTSGKAASLAMALVLIGASLLRTQWLRTREANRQFESLSAEIAEYTRASGAPPSSLNELGWRLFPIFDQGRAIDPWGNLWRYRAPGSDGRDFDLGSTGKDGRPGNDDIGQIPPP